MRRSIQRCRRFAARVLVPVGACIALAFAAPSANADLVAPNANTSTSGNNQQFGIFDSGAWTFQFAYNASQFSTIIGSQITDIGFRLPAGASTITSALVYTSFSIQIGQSTAAPGALSTTFATNEAADTVTAFSGPLTIPAGSFVGGAGPNPFFDLVFTTPYHYTGGNLLVTLRHSDPGVSIAVDANTLASLPSGLADTVASSGSATATTGQEGFFNAPVTNFSFTASAVPELPTSYAFVALGSVVVLAGLVRRKRTA